MENMLDKALKVARSDTVKASGKTLFKDIIGILMYDPNAAWSMLEDVKKLSSTIRDGFFFECLETYILYSYRYNEETNQFESENLQSLAEALADASPNTEANYEGRPDKLNEYAKRLIKLIDDCGTKQKARYIASLTRALLSKQIDTQKFFQLSRCIRNLRLIA